jgi:SAM-dependent methyltransferase
MMRHPRLIRLLYGWNGLVLQRNWATKKALQKWLPTLPENSLIIDAGCGEGMHLFPWAERYPNLYFTGIEKLESHLEFGRRYLEVAHLKNVNFQKRELENFRVNKKAELITCIGVMQYIEKDEAVLKNIFEALSKKGIAVFYVPINGKILTPVYRYFFTQKMHYERSQKRVRIYSEKDFLEKLKNTGFHILEKKYTYGKLGILGHEIYSLLIMGMGNSGWLAPFFSVLMALFIVPILILKKIDYLIEKKDGNGMLLIVSKAS